MHKIFSLLAELSTKLERIDIELLLARSLNQSREFLYSHPEYELTLVELTIFNKLIERRIQGEPIAYILNKREFWSIELYVDKNVLIPRPETELLIEIVLNFLDDKPKLIADLGTGSGAIALALAKERPEWSLVAVDKSMAALDIAKKNATNLQLNNIEFINGDWCMPLVKNKFTAIISNPPYIAPNDQHLQQGDVRFEPKIALIAENGLSDLHKIIIEAKNKLISGGLLLLEHGYDQSTAVTESMKNAGYQDVTAYKDFGNNYRAVSGIMA